MITTTPPKQISNKKQFQLGTVAWMILTSILIFFASSSIRHALFHSTAFDLGIYDQVVYLISQGQSPISSILEFHHLGNHAAWAIYPLSLLYKIYPDVHWLFAVQAICLALGAWPTWSLARQAGLLESQAVAMAAVYLLYPVVFNVNLFDFHPEVMALPALLAAILAARRNQIGWFSVGIIFVLGCKAALSLTIAAMGFWLLIFEKKRRCGLIALSLGVAWFLLSTQLIIPAFIGKAHAAVHRYSVFGDSISEILLNMLRQPGLVLAMIDIKGSIRYLFQLAFPVIWGLSPQHLAPLVSAIPILFLNMLSEIPYQRDLRFQYSIPVLPFLLLAVISTLAAGQGWFRHKQTIVLWSMIAFLFLTRYPDFWSMYPTTLDTWQATREALSQIQTQGGVLTTNFIAPHVTNRPIVKLAMTNTPTDDVTAASRVDFADIDYVLLNRRHPGWLSTPEFTDSLVEKLIRDKAFQLRYQHNDVYLFVKQSETQL